MGTNYYAFSRFECDCGKVHETEHLHIGKSSSGWYFSLHAIPDMELNSLEDWIHFLKQGCICIEDEYGHRLSFEGLLSVIKYRSHITPPDDFDFASNFAEPGVNNLVRAKIDGLHCLSHGEGTWQMIAGEFC